MSKRRFAIALAAGVAVVLAIQLVPVHRTNPPVRTVIRAPDDVEDLLRRACWNCHSNETRWPWYSHVAPTSWLVTDHVHDGREDLNFTEWPRGDHEAATDLIEAIGEQVESGAMPPRSYLLMHPEARLTGEERQRIVDWSLSAGGLDRLDRFTPGGR